jgi:hypothetical protein
MTAMRLGEVFERFIRQAHISVMFRTPLEHALDPAEIDRLFEENADPQYTREVLYSSIVELMGAVVRGAQPSVRADYLASPGEIAASLTALHEKLKGWEPGVRRARAAGGPGRPGRRRELHPGGRLAQHHRRQPGQLGIIRGWTNVVGPTNMRTHPRKSGTSASCRGGGEVGSERGDPGF